MTPDDAGGGPGSGAADGGPSIVVGHVDVDAFFAAVEQRDKPSLRSRPVVVGGVGPRGVVATASYEARAFGISSAMPMSEARRRCPAAAVLAGRFDAYRASSEAVMAVLARHSDAVEQVSLDEAYVALGDRDVGAVVARIRAEITAATGLTASVGVGPTKLVAKIASDDAKPDGVLLVRSDTQSYLDPLAVRRLPGLGPQTEARLRRLGIGTVRQLRGLDHGELIGLLGEAHGSALWRLAHGQDERRVQPRHEAKSVSVEETFDTDLTDRVLLGTVLRRMSEQVGARLRSSGASGRTVSVKARYPDFTTVSRSVTLPGSTDDPRTIDRLAGRLLNELDVSRGLRLLGVGCSGLTSWVQDDLFDAAPAGSGDALTSSEPVGPGAAESGAPGSGAAAQASPSAGGFSAGDVSAGDPSVVDPPVADPRAGDSGWGHHRRGWLPGQDVVHDSHGRGWVWGSGAGIVTVRFESRHTSPGPVMSFSADDPALRACDPEPLEPADVPRDPADVPQAPATRLSDAPDGVSDATGSPLPRPDEDRPPPPTGR